MADIHTVIDSYTDLLAVHSRLYRRFQKRRRDNHESALAEAVTFCWYSSRQKASLMMVRLRSPSVSLSPSLQADNSLRLKSPLRF